MYTYLIGLLFQEKNGTSNTHYIAEAKFPEHFNNKHFIRIPDHKK